MNSLPSNYPPFLAALAATIARQLQELSGLDEAKSNEIAYQAAEAVRAQWGGVNTYIPKGDALDLSKRDWEIYAKCNYRNFAELALEYDLTEVRIRQIVKSCEAEEQRRRQAIMFPAL